MKSIRDIYKIGRGPSSSHTMGPERAARLFLSEHPEADRIEVVLYGSLCKTGVGHGTDRVLREVLQEVDAEIVFSKEDPVGIQHPNTMDFFAYQGPNQTGHIRVESWGGPQTLLPRSTRKTPLRRSGTSANGATSIPSASTWR